MFGIDSIKKKNYINEIMKHLYTKYKQGILEAYNAIYKYLVWFLFLFQL